MNISITEFDIYSRGVLDAEHDKGENINDKIISKIV